MSEGGSHRRSVYCPAPETQDAMHERAHKRDMSLSRLIVELATSDPKRARLVARLRENDLSMARASAAIGRNTTYIQQYLGRGMPKVLSHQDTVALGRILGCDPSEFQHDTLPPAAPRTGTAHSARRLPAVVRIPEIVVNRRINPDAILSPYDPKAATWAMPEPFLRHELHSDPAHVRMLKVEDDAMMPELRAGDRVLIDTSRPWPSLGELYVLWDGNAIVVKRVAWPRRHHRGGKPGLHTGLFRTAREKCT